jgi:hypothetical protein
MIASLDQTFLTYFLALIPIVVVSGYEVNYWKRSTFSDYVAQKAKTLDHQLFLQHSPWLLVVLFVIPLPAIELTYYYIPNINQFPGLIFSVYFLGGVVTVLSLRVHNRGMLTDNMESLDSVPASAWKLKTKINGVTVAVLIIASIVILAIQAFNNFSNGLLNYVMFYILEAMFFAFGIWLGNHSYYPRALKGRWTVLDEPALFERRWAIYVRRKAKYLAKHSQPASTLQ